MEVRYRFQDFAPAHEVSLSIEGIEVARIMLRGLRRGQSFLWYHRPMGIWDFLRGKQRPAKDANLEQGGSGTVESVGEAVLILLDSGRMVRADRKEGSGLEPGTRVAVQYLEVLGNATWARGVSLSDSKLGFRDIPELDEPSPPAPPPTAEEQARQKAAYAASRAQARKREYQKRREWLEREVGSDAERLHEIAREMEFPLVLVRRFEELKRPSLQGVGLPLEGQQAGESRLGGRPFCSQPWPVTPDGRPLSFLAQIELSELTAPRRVLPELPASGRLLFFYDDVTGPWGFEPTDKDHFRVLYEEEGAPSQLQEPIFDSESSPPHRLHLSPFETLPAPFSSEKNDVFEKFVREGTHIVNASECEDAYWDVYDSYQNCPTLHQIGGYPQLIQNEMEVQCELVSSGFSLGGNEEVPNVSRDKAEDWALLLQLCSDEEGQGWLWGDLGNLYFWIRKSDLAKRDFEKTWMILQCT